MSPTKEKPIEAVMDESIGTFVSVSPPVSDITQAKVPTQTTSGSESQHEGGSQGQLDELEKPHSPGVEEDHPQPVCVDRRVCLKSFRIKDMKDLLIRMGFSKEVAENSIQAAAELEQMADAIMSWLSASKHYSEARLCMIDDKLQGHLVDAKNLISFVKKANDYHHFFCYFSEVLRELAEDPLRILLKEKFVKDFEVDVAEWRPLLSTVEALSVDEIEEDPPSIGLPYLLSSLFSVSHLIKLKFTQEDAENTAEAAKKLDKRIDLVIDWLAATGHYSESRLNEIKSALQTTCVHPEDFLRLYTTTKVYYNYFYGIKNRVRLAKDPLRILQNENFVRDFKVDVAVWRPLLCITREESSSEEEESSCEPVAGIELKSLGNNKSLAIPGSLWDSPDSFWKVSERFLTFRLVQEGMSKEDAIRSHKAALELDRLLEQIDEALVTNYRLSTFQRSRIMGELELYPIYARDLMSLVKKVRQYKPLLFHDYKMGDLRFDLSSILEKKHFVEDFEVDVKGWKPLLDNISMNICIVSGILATFLTVSVYSLSKKIGAAILDEEACMNLFPVFGSALLEVLSPIGHWLSDDNGKGWKGRFYHILLAYYFTFTALRFVFTRCPAVAFRLSEYPVRAKNKLVSWRACDVCQHDDSFLNWEKVNGTFGIFSDILYFANEVWAFIFLLPFCIPKLRGDPLPTLRYQKGRGRTTT